MSDKKRVLKLRGAGRYSVITEEHKSAPIERNQTIEVDDKLAEHLLKAVVYDRANQPWPVWQDVTPEPAQVAPEVKKTRRRRSTKKTAAAKPASSAEAA